MATRIENHCMQCAVPAYPCLGEHCSRRRVKVHSCDRCGEDLDAIYAVDGEELCEECLKEMFLKEGD